MIAILEVIINSFLEALLMLNVVNACVKKECKKDKKQLSIIIFISVVLLTISNLYFNKGIHIVISGFLYILIVGVVYRLDIKAAEIVSNSIYAFICIISIIIMGIFYPYLQMLNLEEIDIFNIMKSIMFILKYICLYILFKSKKYIVRLFRIIIKDKVSIIINLMINFVVYYSIIKKNSIIDFDKPLLKNIIVINIFLFFIINSIYFSSIKKESNNIKILNEKLKKNNNDLRKIKHDYGAEISYLYGLYLMKKKEKLGEALKNIIENNNMVRHNMKINKNKAISEILKLNINSDRSIFIDNDIDMDLIKISDEDLSIILNNIITSVDENEMFVRVKNYIFLDKLIINIKFNIKDLCKIKKINSLIM